MNSISSKAAVIGGGIIGLSWAVVFELAGYQVHVHERAGIAFHCKNACAIWPGPLLRWAIGPAGGFDADARHVAYAHNTSPNKAHRLNRFFSNLSGILGIIECN